MACDLLSPDLFLFVSKVICDLLDVGFYLLFLARFGLWMCPDLLFFVAFCLWVPPIMQGISLLGMLALVFLVVGNHQLPTCLPRLGLWPGYGWIPSLLVPSQTYLVPPM